MAVTIQGTYAGGDPRLLEGFAGALRAEADGIAFSFDQVWMDGMSARHRVGELRWASTDLLGISVGDAAYYRGLTVGGLVPVGDDLMLGAMGQVGASSSALVLLLVVDVEGNGRRLVCFAATAPDAQAFVSGAQRERIARSEAPLPAVDEVDAQSRVEDQAEVLREIRDLAREQVELMRTIAARLG